MDFYYSSSFPDESYYHTQIPYDERYHEPYYYYPPVESSASFSSYEFSPAQSLVAYSAWPEGYTNLVSTQYVVHHSAAEADDDLNFVEYDPHPFGGGYDIVQTYGKPLPPGDEICYPRSSSSFKSASASPGKLLPQGKVEDLKAETPVTEEEQGKEVFTEDEEEVVTEDEEEDDSEEDEDQSSDGESYDGLDEKAVSSVQVYGGVEEYNPPVLDQVPPGYGLESFDLCENLFGYWPCLSRMKNKCSSCGREVCVRGDSDADRWKRTADYLFGSPDPYRGWADQSGYAYQMRYQQQPPSTFYQQPPPTLYQQPDQYGQISWFH